MLNNVIKIRDKPCFAHREDPERVAKTVIVSLQLPVRRTEDGEIPMAKKLHDKPENHDCQQNPFSCGRQEITENQTDAVQAECA